MYPTSPISLGINPAPKNQSSVEQQLVLLPTISFFTPPPPCLSLSRSVYLQWQLLRHVAPRQPRKAPLAGPQGRPGRTLAPTSHRNSPLFVRVGRVFLRQACLLAFATRSTLQRSLSLSLLLLVLLSRSFLVVLILKQTTVALEWCRIGTVTVSSWLAIHRGWFRHLPALANTSFAVPVPAGR